MPSMPIFSINHTESNDIDLHNLEKTYISSADDIANEYNPFRLKEIQNYNPIYNRFFTLSETNYNSIQLDHNLHMVSMDQVKDISNSTIHNMPVFIKYSPLLDPIRYMIGKYTKDGDNIYKLPHYNANGFPKIDDYNNAAYTDCFFYYLTSKILHEYKFMHGIDFYGSFVGIQDKYKMNVVDDMEYLMTSSYFNENIDKLFTVCDHDTQSYFAESSRANRARLRISSSNPHNISAISLSDCLVSDDLTQIGSLTDTEIVYDNASISNTPHTSTNSVSHSSSSSEEDSDCNDSSDEEPSSHSDDDESWETDTRSCDESDDSLSTEMEDTQYGYINNFPVQLICLEQCSGTLDELFSTRALNEDTAASALFQVIMMLVAYQKMFHFTHNDLHTNNIMYIVTDKPFLYYKYENLVYKVPTYGKIFKLIDFGRSIYKYKGKTMCSDSFGPGGDAATQYNCEPYIDETKPIIEPNYSFDLCRLGCSIYDFIIPDDVRYVQYDDLQKTVYRWCMDDRGKNVLYKKNGEERYPNFKLYKMAARTVHDHTPQEQLNHSYFKQFLYTNPNNTIDQECMNIDELPCCA